MAGSLATNVDDLALAVSTEIKADRVSINGNDGTGASRLVTTATTLVDAVNEIDGRVDDIEDAVGAASGIDDAATATTTTWSSSKVSTELAGKAAAVHSHAIADTTGLQAALDGKAATSHSHTVANVTDFASAVDARIESRLDVSTADLDTFREVADALASNDTAVSAINTQLANRVRFDAPQTIGDGGVQARANIGAAAAADLGDLTGFDPVATFEAGLA